ncbi:HoxN/HupN/NixA family nickel/cobalt transporter [Reyranella sp.]|jgi:high-affinity nickel-transport protein|uniref:HoxN/HupN/NixA family nickel/cobalt transporter n=1 Tax=Reyranella sp. TaxID=1929291 RepID=UPI002F95754F
MKRPSLFALYAFLIAGNLAAWGWAVIAFRDHPALLGAALLAWGFGLRHAVDADHIAAIDNVTRKLVQAGQRPLLVGFHFALGHSTVVALASAGVAAAATLIARRFEAFHEIGSLVGTVLSALFLFTIAAVNLVILQAVWRTFRHVRRGGRYLEDDFDLLLMNRGLLARLFQPLFRLITRSWHMFPLGFLFGLGFDTATEVSLLGIAASETTKGLSLWSILVFPALFAAGMSLVDTTDGVLMLGACQWAFVNPVRKLYYNLVITFLSVVVAVSIGGIELLGLLGDRLGLDGRFWSAAHVAAAHLNEIGLVVIVLMIATWLGSVAIWRYRRLGAASLDRGP